MIGILTLSAAENYGAVLQCHSLCEYIREKGAKAEIIDYTPKFINGRYKWVNIDKSTTLSCISSFIREFIKLPFVFIKKYRFHIFRKKYGLYSAKRYVGELYEDRYDLYIVGSDQIWNLELTNFDKNFLLCFCNDSIKKNSYAASIGVEKINKKSCELYKKYLSTFNHISVREEQGVEILNPLLSGKKIIKNIDPVFLHGKKYWSELASERMIKEKYVLLYIFKEYEIAQKLAHNIAAQYKIYSINKAIIEKDHIKNKRCVGPAQFLSLIKNAEYVITDSFHGTAFSIIFNKQFYTIPYKGTSSRMINLLTEFHLESRLYEGEIKNDAIDYNLVNRKIKKLIQDADKYLNEIIEEIVI